MSGDDVDIRDLVAECLELADSGGSTAIDDFCEQHPEQADEIRRRLEALGALGLVGDVEPEASFPDHVGDYRLVERLGHGGMGVVFRARQEGLDRDVALKLVRPENLVFDRARERFRREIEAVARLRHPGIVPIHSVGEENGIPFFVMEMIEGRTLDQVVRDLAERAPESLAGDDLLRAAGGAEVKTGFSGSWTDACAYVIEQVAAALAHAHGQGILHRDVKPSNIMLTPHGQAVLLDFGLARREGAETMTRSGAMLGTIQYMAPEQLRGEEADARSDVYSLAVTFYELLTLRAAHAGRSTEHVRESILRGVRPSIRGMNSAVSWEAETVCLVGADLDAARRYATAAELAADLGRLRDRLPIRARRPGAILRSRRWVERHPTTSVALALAVAVLVVLPLILLAKERENTKNVRRERDMALKAVEGLLVRVGAKTLDDVPQVELLRHGILEEALELYEEMLARSPDDARLRRSAADAYKFAADVRSDLGRQEDAREALRRGLALVDTLVANSPDDSNLDLAASLWSALGDLEEAGLRYDEARKHYAHAVDLHERRLAADGDDVRTRIALAFVRTKLAGATEQLGDVARAHEEFREILEEEDILRLAPPEIGETLSQVYHRFGMAARALGDFETAEEFVLKAVEWQRGLIATEPARGRLRMNLAEIERTLAGILQRLGRASEASAMYREPVRLLERLVTDYPRTTAYRNRYARALFSLAAAEHRSGRFDEAERLYLESIDQHDRTLAAQDGKPDYERQRAQALVNLAGLLNKRGEPEDAEDMLDDAITTLGRLVREHPDHPMNWAGLEDACQKMSDLLAAAGEKERAIEFLEQAVAHSREVVRLLPTSPVRRGHLAGTLHNLALLRGDEASLELLFEAFDLQADALRSLPNDPLVVRCLRNHAGLIVGRLWTAKRFGEALDYIDRYAALRADDGVGQWFTCVMYGGTLQRLADDTHRARAVAGLAAALSRGRELDFITAALVDREGAFLTELSHHPEIAAALPKK